MQSNTGAYLAGSRVWGCVISWEYCHFPTDDVLRLPLQRLEENSFGFAVVCSCVDRASSTVGPRTEGSDR